MLAIKINAATKYFYEKDNNNLATSGLLIGKLRRRKKKKITAVDHVSMQVPKGEIYGIIGPNGSGKSTLIRMLSTLILPDYGELFIFGMNVVNESMQVRKSINRVSVDAAFFKKLSAWENLSYAARLYGLKPKDAKVKAIKILEGMNFSVKRINEPLENLSRGMQQKVAIARALFTSPSLLLLDEPTTGLDPVSKRQVQEFVTKIRAENNTTVLLTSHDMDEVERVCDKVAIIDKGRFIASGTPEKLISSNGDNKTLEDVFFDLTGKNLQEDIAN